MSEWVNNVGATQKDFCLLLFLDIYLLLPSPLSKKHVSCLGIYRLACLTGSMLKWYGPMGPLASKFCMGSNYFIIWNLVTQVLIFMDPRWGTSAISWLIYPFTYVDFLYVFQRVYCLCSSSGQHSDSEHSFFFPSINHGFIYTVVSFLWNLTPFYYFPCPTLRLWIL